MTWQFSGSVSRAGDSYASTDGYPRSLDDEPDYDDPDAYDYDDYDDDYDDSGRWKWVAWLATAVMILAAVATAVILNGGDSSSTAGRVVPSVSRPAVSPPPTPTTSLPAETMTTVTPAAPPSPTASSTPPQPTATAAATAPAPQVDPRTLVYTVSGTKQPGDIITVTYTDDKGAIRTDFNVALPWHKTIVSGTDVLLNSVTAASFVSRLNCTITDGTGQTLVSQNYNTIAITCNR